MALNGKTISAGVLDILNIDGGVSASTARNVKDGDGTVTPLWLTTTKIGIGESSPDTHLHIKGTTAELLLEENSTRFLRFNTRDNDMEIGWDDGDELVLGVFATTTDSSITPLMKISNDGKVGIGTTTPSAYLHINQNTDLGSSVGDKQIYFKTSGDTTNNDTLETSLIRVSTDSSGADFESAQWRIQRKVEDTYMGWIGFGAEEGSGINNYGISFGVGSDGGGDNPLTVDEAMRIEGSNGYVGIGTTSPVDKFHVADGTATNYVAKFEHTEAGGSADPRGIRIDFASDLNNSDDYFFLCKGASTTKMTVRGDGDVWTVDDNILSSDRDMKENIVDASPKLDDLLKLKVRNFNWKSQYKPDSSKKIGFIAQEVEEVFPALVREHLSPIESEANAGVMRKEIKQSFVPMLVKAIQELTAKVTALENA